MFSFIDIRLIDVVDIALSAYLMYSVYKLIRGTMAAHIVLSILGFLVFGIVVRALNMSILSSAIGSLLNIGLLALIVIFQQEIRNFLVLMGTRYSFLKRIGLDDGSNTGDDSNERSTMIKVIADSCANMSETKTGALIVIERSVGLKEYVSTGEPVDAVFSQQLIETIFFKNTPLHDGAMIVNQHRILAAGCILPVSKNTSIPKSFGLRHRSALGITEVSDAITVVVSEETGNISVFEHAEHRSIADAAELAKYLEER